MAICAALVTPLWDEKVSEAGVSETAGAGPAVPVPLRVTVWGEPVALSATETVAVKLAADAGLKVTEMEQLAPAASELPQVLVWAKSAGLVPVMEMPLMESAAEPVFLSVAAWAALVVPLCAEKLSEAGVSDTAGAGAVVPAPVSVAACGEPVALSATESVAEKLVAEAGVKVTEMEQWDPAASELPQVLVWLKSAGFVPAMEMLPIASAAVPLFERVMVCAVALLPTAVLGKASVVGLSDADGAAGPVMVKVSGLEAPPPGAGLVTVTAGLPAVVTSVAWMAAVSCVALTKVVVRATPLKLTTAPLTKLDPLTVRVKAPEPAVVVDGRSEVMAGTGLEAAGASWLTVKVWQPAVMVRTRAAPVLFCATL